MTINQARDILDKVLANLQMTRQDHAVLQQALGLLYAKAKDNQDATQEIIKIGQETIKEYGLEDKSDE